MQLRLGQSTLEEIAREYSFYIALELGSERERERERGGGRETGEIQVSSNLFVARRCLQMSLSSRDI